MDQELVKQLQKLGLNSYEAKIYLALLERSSLSVNEVAKLAQVPRTRAYDTLDKLASDGLAILRPGKFLRYSAVDFDYFEDSLISRVDERSIEQKNIIRTTTNTIKKQLEPILKVKDNGFDPLNYIEIIKNPFQIFKKFMQLCSNAKEEVLVMTKPPKDIPPKKILKLMDEILVQEANILKNGIKGKCIYELPSNEDIYEWWFEIMERAVRAGEEARVIKEIPIFMYIFDSRVVMTTLVDPVSRRSSTLTTQIVEHRSLAETLKIVFETLWERAEDYHTFRARNNP